MKDNRFLHRQGQKILDKYGKEINLAGWGLGNWFLQEGYMWGADNCKRFDRSRRIEQVLIELTGKEYAQYFWQEFRKRYITKSDILYMKKLGYNSVRIPLDWRTLMEESEGIHWKEDGFKAVDNCLEWCEEAGLYAFLDLHGAPGGQTGANIDDCIDDVPRLFIDQDCWDKAIALWKKLAWKYKDREIVGGYDLLNEPIAPGVGERNFDYLIPKLEAFYTELIQAVRAIDPDHMLSIEGPHWATDLRIFRERQDENMVLHFHRYAEKPDINCLQKFIDKAKQLDVPLWLGESGESINEWYAALYPLAASFGIGYNLWPWKKLGNTNCPCEIKKPNDYDAILQYAKGGKHPGYQKARVIFDEYLENILLENCILHQEVTRHVLRKPPFSIYAVDFDEMPGRGIAYRSNLNRENPFYRSASGMDIICTEPERENQFVFDSQWDRFSLHLMAGEFVCYSFCNNGSITIHIDVETSRDTQLLFAWGWERKEVMIPAGTRVISENLLLKNAGDTTVKIEAQLGEIVLKRISFEKL